MGLEWNMSLSTGVPEIDLQHQELFQRINRLLEAMSRGAGKQELQSTLKFLGDYVQQHFRDEEAYMDRVRCPAAAANKAAHARLIDVYQKFSQRVQTEGATPVLVIQLQKELTYWIVNHVAQIDTQLAACVRKKAG